MERKKLIVHYNNLPPGVLEAIQKKYPLGWSNYVIKVETSNGFFYAITVDTEEASYLVKVNVKIDSPVDNDKEPVVDEVEIDDEIEDVADEPEEFDQLDD